MTQRYIDIANLSTLIIMEVVVGALFVSSVKGNRSSTWVKTRLETYAIIAGIISSFEGRHPWDRTDNRQSCQYFIGLEETVHIYHKENTKISSPSDPVVAIDEDRISRRVMSEAQVIEKDHVSQQRICSLCWASCFPEYQVCLVKYKGISAGLLRLCLCFALKIVIKATHKTRSQDSTFGKDSAVSYHVESFLQFVLSEFLLIAVWTWFKAPEDFFAIYNNLPISKFSIFQRISGESKSDGGKTPCGGGETDTGECNGRSESMAELQGDGRGNGGGYRDSLLSGGRDQRGTEGGDFGGSIGKRSI